MKRFLLAMITEPDPEVWTRSLWLQVTNIVRFSCLIVAAMAVGIASFSVSSHVASAQDPFQVGVNTTQIDTLRSDVKKDEIVQREMAAQLNNNGLLIQQLRDQVTDLQRSSESSTYWFRSLGAAFVLGIVGMIAKAAGLMSFSLPGGGEKRERME